METHIDEEDQKYKTGGKRGKAQRKPKCDVKPETSTALSLPTKKGLKKKGLKVQAETPAEADSKIRKSTLNILEKFRNDTSDQVDAKTNDSSSSQESTTKEQLQEEDQTIPVKDQVEEEVNEQVTEASCEPLSFDPKHGFKQRWSKKEMLLQNNRNLPVFLLPEN